MPQVFQVLRCYKCLVFQVQQTKKSNKFQCKLCGEKQSIKRHYGIGTAKDCRLHVQRLNEIRGQIDEINQSKGSDSDNDNEPVNFTVQSITTPTQCRKSKWSDYVDKEEEVLPSGSEIETMHLNNNEVVLEMPKKCKKTNFKCPSLKISTKSSDCIDICEENMSNYIVKTKNQNIINENPAVFKGKSINKIGAKGEIKEYIPPTTNANKEVIKDFILPAVNRNSRWAQFVEEDEILDDDNLILDIEHFETINGSQGHKTCVYEDEHSNIHSKNSQEMFALCEDNDLDNVLDI